MKKSGQKLSDSVLAAPEKYDLNERMSVKKGDRPALFTFSPDPKSAFNGKQASEKKNFMDQKFSKNFMGKVSVSPNSSLTEKKKPGQKVNKSIDNFVVPRKEHIAFGMPALIQDNKIRTPKKPSEDPNYMDSMF